MRREDRKNPYELNGARFLFIDTVDIPAGSAEVNIKIDDNGVEYMSTMIAGNMAMKVTEDPESKGDTVQNEPMWACFLRDVKKDEKEAAGKKLEEAYEAVAKRRKELEEEATKKRQREEDEKRAQWMDSASEWEDFSSSSELESDT